MNPDHERMTMLLLQLHELELRLPLPHERSILEVAKLALREEVSRLSHRLFDLRYLRPVPAVAGARVAV